MPPKKGGKARPAVSVDERIKALNPMGLQQVFNEINLLRQFPKNYACYLESYLEYFKGTELHVPGEEPAATEEGATVFEECIKELNDLPGPLPPLKYLDKDLCKIAQGHAKDIGRTGSEAHEGKDGSNPGTRIDKLKKGSHNSFLQTCGECLSYGKWTAKDIVIQLVVDDSIPDRGHRKNLLNPRFSCIGVAVEKHKKHTVMCCIVLTDLYGESLITDMCKQCDMNPKDPADRKEMTKRVNIALKNRVPKT